MAGELQPLDQKFAIVGPDGRPTLYFIQWAQQKQIDISGSITADQAIAIIVQYLDEHRIQEGSGIQISPSGNLTDMPTIAADVQEILDQISATRGTVLYRGLLGWAALAPGTAGQFLKTNGAGADPAWATPAAGGGGAWSLISSTAIAAPTASIDVSVVGYSDVLILARAVTLATSGVRCAFLSTNAGVSYFTASGNYVDVATAGTEANTSFALNHGTASNLARDFGGIIQGVNIANAPKWCTGYSAVTNRLFVADIVNPVNKVRICGFDTGTLALINMTGGNVYVFAR